MSDGKQDKITHFVGNFGDAHVAFGGFVSVAVDREDFAKPFHDVDYRGHTYRFINPDHLSDESLDVMMRQPNAYVFGGDMRDLLLLISKYDISVEHVPGLDVD